ncbi:MULTISPECIES: hypothetical protein [Leptospira]|uniref:hypothetical protein n=1 Tax=Leptospira TaxID=171 RepID=UPI0002983326|nr:MULTISPECIES: hypothetical protein [Leptospira]EKR84513.1 hypothetical protein LEP1GSC099_1751 [Leptospira interrogans str. UI 08452]EMN94769.1 hypothetical protein LEP1GSC110_3395 [Leptospira interrogans serovar Medanensis str. UT053]EMO02043.1 hypothetical protein LEP1GSC112_0303 [Leptospira interrogans serovar Pomona str. UT364]KGE21774.1 hypothetical protein IQ65_22360 [Leptospira interrogans serovar Lai]UML78075.1 hypothetical protein FH583_11375 [Leptospira interrogans]
MNEIVAINLICADGSMIFLKISEMTIIDWKMVEAIQKNATSGGSIKDIQEQLEKAFKADPS